MAVLSYRNGNGEIVPLFDTNEDRTPSFMVANHSAAANDDYTQTISGSAVTTVSLDNVKLSNSDGADFGFSPSFGVICRKDGYVEVVGSVHCDGLKGVLLCQIRQNGGSNIVESKSAPQIVGGVSYMGMLATPPVIVAVKAGNFFELRVRDYGSSDSSPYYVLGGSRNTFLRVRYL